MVQPGMVWCDEAWSAALVCLREAISILLPILAVTASLHHCDPSHRWCGTGAKHTIAVDNPQGLHEAEQRQQYAQWAARQALKCSPVKETISKPAIEN